MWPLFWMRFILVFETCFMVDFALALGSYTTQTDYIPLYRMGENNLPVCNDSTTHSPGNLRLYVADKPDGNLCKLHETLVQSSYVAINKSCTDTNYLLQDSCFNASLAVLSFTVQCEDKNSSHLAAVQIRNADCDPYELMIEGCTITNFSIVNLKIDALESIDKSLENDFNDCKMLIAKLPDVCDLICNNSDCLFHRKCLHGFDTRCFVTKYVFAEATCSPKEDKFVYHILTSSNGDGSWSFSFNMSCPKNSVIDIINIQVLTSEIDNYTCDVKEAHCSSTEVEEIINGCNNKSECNVTKTFTSLCINHAIYRASYVVTNGRRRKIINQNSCHQVIEPIDLCKIDKNVLQYVTFYPSYVNDCLTNYNISITQTVNSIVNNKGKCNGNSRNSIIVPFEEFNNHSCLILYPKIIVIGSCKSDYSNVNASIMPQPIDRSSTVSTKELTTTLHTDLHSTTFARSTQSFSYHRDDITTVSSTESVKQKSKASVGPIVGGVLGSITVIAGVIVVLLFFNRKRSNLHYKTKNEQPKTRISQNLQNDYTGVQNVAFPKSKNAELSNEELQNDCYHEIADSLINLKNTSTVKSTNRAETNVYCMAQPVEPTTVIKMVHDQGTKLFTYELAQPLDKTTITANTSATHTNFGLPCGTYEHADPASGVDNDDMNHYGNRGSNTYDTTRNQTQYRKNYVDNGNSYAIPASRTYDLLNGPGKFSKTSETIDNGNPYDLRVGGIYDTSQLCTNPGMRDQAEDISPYDFRVSGTYDLTQRVTGGLKKHEDDSTNTYDHFFGQKDVDDYDEIRKNVGGDSTYST